MRSGESNVWLGFLAWILTAILAIYVIDTAVTSQDYISANLALLTQPQVFMTLFGIWVAGTAYFLQQLAAAEAAKKTNRKLLITLAVGVFLVATAMAWIKPMTARDPTYYVAFGRQVAELKVNPYKTWLRECTTDPIIAQVPQMWFNTPCLYGPLMVAEFTLGNLLSPSEDLLTICSTLRLLYIPMVALFGLMLYRAWGWSRWPLTLTFAVLCNPIYLHLAVNSAHPEAWLVFFLLATCLSMMYDRPILAALCFSAACSTKIVPIVLIPVYLCWWLRKGWPQMGKFLTVFTLVHGSIYWFLDGADYPGVLMSAEEGWNPLRVTGGPVIRTFLALSFPEKTASRLALLGFFIVGGAFCLWLLRTKKPLPNAYAVTSITLALLYFFRTTCTAWYTLWFWPFLWLAYRNERNTAISLATWTVSVYLARGMGWSPMIWLFTFAYSHNLWLLWKERSQS